MAAGLPCIASIRAGATYDLIKDGVNGFVMDFYKTKELSEKINWLLDNPRLSNEIAKNACSFIQDNASIDKSAEGFIRSIKSVLHEKLY